MEGKKKFVKGETLRNRRGTTNAFSRQTPKKKRKKRRHVR